MKGIDCATKLNGATARAIRAAGYEFVGRYLVPNQGSLAWKALTREEAEAICGAGLRLLTVFEGSADRARGGETPGAIDGQRAYALAREIGMPETGIIYFAVDYDAPAGDMRTIADYLRAARRHTGPYEIGVYGSYSVVEEMAVQGVCQAFWQCVAWSGGRKSAKRNVYQYGFGQTVAGVSVDVNDCADMDAAGIWTYPGAEATAEFCAVAGGGGMHTSTAFLSELPLRLDALERGLYDTEDAVRALDARMNAAAERYQTIAALPEWARDSVRALCEADILHGQDESRDADGYPARLDLSGDMLRLLVVLQRVLAFHGCGGDSCPVTF